MRSKDVKKKAHESNNYDRACSRTRPHISGLAPAYARTLAQDQESKWDVQSLVIDRTAAETGRYFVIDTGVARQRSSLGPAFVLSSRPLVRSNPSCLGKATTAPIKTVATACAV